MTSPKRHSALPPSLPPRMLSLDQASEYVGLSVTSFLQEVAAGGYPPPDRLIKIRRRLWDVRALDAAIDRRNGREVVNDDWEARKREWQKRKDRNATPRS